MSASQAATSVSPAADEPSRLANASTFLVVGVLFTAITAAGAMFADGHRLAMSWLMAVVFWIAVSLGALVMVLLHHIFDAGWSTVIRRPLEHWIGVFPLLAGLFAPLVLLSLFGQHDLLWKWMDHEAVAGDILWVKKSAFLNPTAFVVFNILFFGAWIWVAGRLRKHSFAQDDDGSVEHTLANRKTAAFGIPLTALTLTFAAFYWLMSLEYHWFSTIYGVWFFATGMKAALALTVLICLYLVRKGVFAGIFQTGHLLNLGNILLAFTVFWAYISFSQYFLIYNANVPEETFWYNLRELNLASGERNSWWDVGLLLLFGNFFLPFFFFLGNANKKKPARMVAICVWILLIAFVDIAFNALPSIKQANGDAIPFGVTVFDVTALVGIGALCFWSFFRSFARTRCIPIRDPRIVESLHCHE